MDRGRYIGADGSTLDLRASTLDLRIVYWTEVGTLDLRASTLDRGRYIQLNLSGIYVIDSSSG